MCNAPNQDWATQYPAHVVKAIISSRTSTDIYNPHNKTIVGVMDLSSPVPAPFSPDQFFQLFDLAMTVNTTKPGWIDSIASNFLIYFDAQFLIVSEGTIPDWRKEADNYETLAYLQRLIATSISLCTKTDKGPGAPPQNKGLRAMWVAGGYKVLPSRRKTTDLK